MKNFFYFLRGAALLLTAAMCLGLCACGDRGDGTAVSQSSQPQLIQDSMPSLGSETGSSLPKTTLESNDSSAFYNTFSASSQPEKNSSSKASSVAANTSSHSTTVKPAKTNFLKGVWISCYEMNFKGCTEQQMKERFTAMMKTVRSQGYNTVFCHVRAFGDAYYPSKYFPFSANFSGTAGKDPGYDPLKIMIAAAKENGLSFHAWINPYRVRSSAKDASVLCDSDPAKKWLHDGSGNAVFAAGGIYYNPGSVEVQRLVLNGVREILANYKVDGIHFDDYFYPTTAKEFDLETYRAYQKAGGKSSLEDWRRSNVNALVSQVWRECKKYPGVVFGISPSAHISTDKTDRNYKNQYADIALWMSSAGYVDYVAPQLYFGYNYPQAAYRYATLLAQWRSLKLHASVQLYIGLAGYKVGDQSVLDKADFCGDSGNLLARQVNDAVRSVANQHDVSGIINFSYSFCMGQDQLHQKEIASLKTALAAIK